MPELPKIDIRPDHWEIVRSLLQKHVPQYEVWAFGSRAKWTAKDYSDLDLAVITSQPMALSVSASLSDDFSESDLPWKVDVVDWATTNESFREIIARDKVVVQGGASRGRPVVPEYSLESLCLLVVDCPHATPKWTESGVVVLRNQNIKAGRLDLSSPSFTDEEHYLGRTKRAVPTAGDIVITREAPMGDVCLIPEGLRCCLGQRQVLLRTDPRKVDARFLLFALQSPYIQFQIGWNEGTGSTVSNLRIPVLESLKIPTPPMSLQVEIATTLAALDDRITLLRESNATLEAIAQAMFKSWFVDFDPVRAKLEGRTPEGMDEATARLFPDGFEESELGLVPTGWRVQSFRETIHIIGGGTPKTSNPDFWGGDIPWFSVVDAPAASDVFVVDTEKRIAEACLNGSSTKLLPTGTTIISARGTVGRLALTGCPMTMNQSCYGLRGIAGDSYFTYFSTKRLVEQLKQRAHGSVFDTITQESFAGVLVSFPNEGVISGFDGCVESLMLRIRENLMQAQTLATLRDTLLPRLISGQLRLPKAQTTVEEESMA